MKIIKLLAIVSLIGALSTAQAAIYYVKAGAAAGGNGTSWSKAFNSLDSALAAADAKNGFDQIWVAKGTYKPTIPYGGTYTGSESNLVTFKLHNNLAMYGCFAGNETSLSKRNCDLNPTILSGDINGDDINNASNLQNFKADNAWHVLTADGVKHVTLDSFIIRDGYAAGPDLGVVELPNFIIESIDYIHSAGGGVLVRNGSDVTLNKLRFDYNASDNVRATIVANPALGSPSSASGGGAIAAVDDKTLVTINNSIFDINNSFGFGGNGGALHAVLEGSLTANTSSFTNHTADRFGGAIHAKDAGIVKVTDSYFKNNKIVGAVIGDESGGAIGVINSNLDVSGSHFDQNMSGPIAGGGGGIVFHLPFDEGEAYTFKLDNSLFTNNQAFALGGGGVDVIVTTPHKGSKATITNTAFVGNTGGLGGGLYIDSLPTVASNLYFSGNTAWVNGGGMFVTNFGDAIFGVTDLADRPKVKLSNSVFIGNSIIGTPAGVLSPVAVLDLFSTFQSTSHGLPATHVTALNPGGGGLAAEMGANLEISRSSFIDNLAINGPTDAGGGLLVGGSEGIVGVGGFGMNQAFTIMKNSFFSGNLATEDNNTAVRDPGNLGDNPEGVQLISK